MTRGSVALGWGAARVQGDGGVSVGVSATVGADFRIDGGAWAPIPDTVTLTAARVSLSVKQARAVLINP